MAAHRIIRVNNNYVLPRCKSEGTLMDLSEGLDGPSLSEVKGQCFTGVRPHHAISRTERYSVKVLRTAEMKNNLMFMNFGIQ